MKFGQVSFIFFYLFVYWWKVTTNICSILQWTYIIKKNIEWINKIDNKTMIEQNSCSNMSYFVISNFINYLLDAIVLIMLYLRWNYLLKEMEIVFAKCCHVMDYRQTKTDHLRITGLLRCFYIIYSTWLS